MVQSIPRHLLKKISILYVKHKYNQFKFRDAVETLGHNEKYTGQILSKLVATGWISKERSYTDKRNKIYAINEFDNIFLQMGEDLLSTQNKKN